MNFDIIVVGAGHAGCEAAYCASKLGFNVALITSNINNIADMACNPSIGGTAKGVVVREIDALGGIMGKIADKSHIQIKMLNSGKGPAVQSLRSQADKIDYPKNMLKMLKSMENLSIIEEMIEDLIIENNQVKGVISQTNNKYNSKIVILTTGTYLKASVLIGDTKIDEGPHGEKRSETLSDKLHKLGFNLQRLKTGTPPRIARESVNFSILKEELGDNVHRYFSFDDQIPYDLTKQEKCYLLYTNDITHKTINENLEKSSMYGGFVTGIGPRYCPSIEDKIVRFSDKERHQLFLEPESIHYDEMYLQGLSTSMPKDVQEKLVKSIKGLENAKIVKYAYAIEYDAIDPLQVYPTLETKIIKNLFTAGQINGTSGYEEAACQGLIAAINATAKLSNKEPLILKRNEAYIGVLIDDLVTKGTHEPYRLLTSRAEFRLLLRHDNADLRLRKYGYEYGLINQEQYDKLIEKEKNIQNLIDILKKTRKIISINNVEYSNKSFYQLLKHPEIKILDLVDHLEEKYSNEVYEQVEITIKYEGYITKSNLEAQKLIKMEDKQIPENLDYNKVKNLASEARQKLIKIQPKTIGQASRISGVNPVDISVLSVYMKKEYGK